MKKILNGLRFGAVTLGKGGVPLLNSAVNVIEHFSGKDLATGKPIVGNTDWGKIALKAVGAAAMIYLLSEGYIDVNVILEFIKNLL